METCVNGMKCDVVEWVYFEVVWSSGEIKEFLKKVYASVFEDPRRRGRPVVKLKDRRVKEYKHDKSGDRGRELE